MSESDINKIEENEIQEGGYKVLECIGKGSYGTVYKALDTCGNTYAIKAVEFSKMRHKTMRFNSTTDEFTISTILSKECLKGNADYIGIVKIYNVFRTDQRYYIVMELLDGQTLEDFVQTPTETEKDYLSEDTFKQIAFQILSGLSFLGSLNIAHRDIKPDNIFIKRRPGSSGYEVKIIDIGLGRISEERPYVDMWGRRECMRSSVGTPLYASPEIEFCNGYTKRCDLWSAGMTLYYLATGTDLVAADPATYRYEKKRVWEECGKEGFRFRAVYSDEINGLLGKMMARRGPSAKEILGDIWLGAGGGGCAPLAKREEEPRVIDLVKECQRSCVQDFKGFNAIPLEQ